MYLTSEKLMPELFCNIAAISCCLLSNTGSFLMLSLGSMLLVGLLIQKCAHGIL